MYSCVHVWKQHVLVISFPSIAFEGCAIMYMSLIDTIAILSHRCVFILVGLLCKLNELALSGLYIGIYII